MSTRPAAARAVVSLLAFCGLACALPSAHAQVVINEAFLNPPGSGSAADDVWEYIELYGTPGMSLNGYALATVFGGGDPNDNNVPGPLPAGWDGGDDVAEIDEAWSLDGLTIGANGLLVIYNNARAGAGVPNAGIPFFAAQTASATFAQAHIPTVDVAGRIKNDGSCTLVLLRKRPFHTLNASGQSVYDGVLGSTIVNGPLTFPPGIRYAWRKDTNPDVNYNGRVDFNGLGVLAVGGGPVPPEVGVNSERLATPPVGNPRSLEPYQMVDDIAWSNGGGKEYVRSSQQELSDTLGFNPDAVSRLRYRGANPGAGHVFVGGIMKPTRMADEEFIYGDIFDAQFDGDPLIRYNPATTDGPTDPASPNRYNASGQLTPGGAFLLDDINVTGFVLTPGQFNDVDATGAGGIQHTQFRFVRGDFNFDGVVTTADRDLIVASLGQGLDDTAEFIEDSNTTTNMNDDIRYTGWKHQGRAFNALLAMVRMSLTDGTTGVWNSGVTVTSADVAQFNTEFPFGPVACGPSDVAGPGQTVGADGQLTADDIIVFIGWFFAADARADVAGAGQTPGADGQFTADDIIVFIGRFFAGC